MLLFAFFFFFGNIDEHFYIHVPKLTSRYERDDFGSGWFFLRHSMHDIHKSSLYICYTKQLFLLKNKEILSTYGSHVRFFRMILIIIALVQL